MKECPQCHTTKPLSSFGIRYGKYSQSWCKKCTNDNNKKQRKIIRDWIVNYKQQLSCEMCGEDRYYTLVFHHRNEETKKFSLANAPNTCHNMEMIQKEIEKCQVLCANCHNELHYKKRNGNQ